MRQRDNPFIVKRGSNDLLQRVVRDGREVVAEVDKEDVPAFPVRAVVGDKLLLQPSDGEVGATAFRVGRVVQDERGRERRDEGVHRQRLVNHPFGDMDARNVAKLPAFVQLELVEPSPNVVSGKKVAARLDDVAQHVLLVPLNRRFPRDAVLSLNGGAVKAVQVGDVFHRAGCQALAALLRALFLAPRAARPPSFLGFQKAPRTDCSAAFGIRMRRWHETALNAEARRHASSVRHPSRGADSRAQARTSRLPSSTGSAFGHVPTRSGRSAESGQGANPRVRRGVVVGIAIVVDVARVNRRTSRHGAKPPIDATSKA